MTKVRISESKLNRIIAESVRRALSEMDWRTAQSAADASTGAKNGGVLDYDMMRRKSQYDKKHGKGAWDERAKRFHQYAATAFNRDNGYKDEKNREYYSAFAGGANSMNTGSRRYASGKNGDYYSDETEQWVDGRNEKFDDGSEMKRGNVRQSGMNSSGDKRSQALRNAQQKGDKEVADYYQGKTTYRRGQGWGNYNESKLDRIVSESLKSVLSKKMKKN